MKLTCEVWLNTVLVVLLITLIVSFCTLIYYIIEIIPGAVGVEWIHATRMGFMLSLTSVISSALLLVLPNYLPE